MNTPSSSNIRIETVPNGPRELQEQINQGLNEHNQAQLGSELNSRYQPLVVAARNEAGDVVGGILGYMVWDFTHIDTLWVAESHRGLDIGTQLMDQAEQEAIALGFPHISLETTSFQALAFYQKRGFTIAGQVPNKPKGHTWYYLEKDLS